MEQLARKYSANIRQYIDRYCSMLVSVLMDGGIVESIVESLDERLIWTHQKSRTWDHKGATSHSIYESA